MIDLSKGAQQALRLLTDPFIKKAPVDLQEKAVVANFGQEVLDELRRFIDR
jgi:hypothetical protein